MHILELKHFGQVPNCRSVRNHHLYFTNNTVLFYKYDILLGMGLQQAESISKSGFFRVSYLFLSRFSLNVLT
jgi:hypothetical protein